MPLDVLRRLLLPLRERVVTSCYPDEPALVTAATRGLPTVDPARCERGGGCVAARGAGGVAGSGGVGGVAASRGVAGSGGVAICVGVCPTGAIAVTQDTWSIDAGRCIFCGDCQAACPNGAIQVHPTVELAGASRAGLVARTPLPGGGPAVTTLEPTAQRPDDRLRAEVLRRLGRSLHVRHLDAGSCNGCDWELAALLNPYHDLQRLGIDFVASPRHADLLLVTGTMTRNLEAAARRTFDAMAEPRLVVAVGACAISGGPFAGSSAGRDGIAEVLPVDVFVPGCPPRPEAVIDGLLLAVGRRSPRRPPPRSPGPG